MEKPAPSIFTLLNVELYPRAQEIEVASSLQIPLFQIIGLPGPEVNEARERIRSAIESSGFDFPRRKITLNLSPASVRKKGTGLDLAMAIAVLIEGIRIDGGKTSQLAHQRIFAWGELGLDGRVKPVGNPARSIACAIEGGAECLFVSNAEEPLFRETRDRLFAETTDRLPILGIEHLSEAVAYLRDGEVPMGVRPDASPASIRNAPRRTSDESLLPLPLAIERTIRIAASGAHHFLVLGPKGTGKSHALEWFLALQPEPDLETRRLRRFLGEISGKSAEEPYRRVSTQAPPASLLGSFSSGVLRPGELSLAHGGVLLADEFPEWSRDAREALRDPLERRRLTLTRVDGAIDLPSDFIFAGNGNLCPCGGLPDAPTQEGDFACRCHPLDRRRYLSRLSGPILDRLDLVSILTKRPEPASELSGESAGIRSGVKRLETLREDCAEVRARLYSRYGMLPGKMPGSALESILGENPDLRTAIDAIPFRSFRDRHKTVRIALTVAAQKGLGVPDAPTLLEARMIRAQSDAFFRVH